MRAQGRATVGGMESPEHERRDVVRYFEMEHGTAKVEHAEKVASERVFERTFNVWDVHSTEGKWWVVTNLTNLYSQAEFPSMDHVLSFHIGLTSRIGDRDSRRAQVDDEERDRVSSTWRRWEQAADALNEADEAEEFQAVGMRLREALLSFVREVAEDRMVPSGEEVPKLGDFVHWSERIAEVIAAGESSARFRRYLKRIASATWDLANWLTHAADATRLDAHVAVDAAGHVLSSYSSALVRHERGAPARCPVCSSYRLVADYRPELGNQGAYVTLCASCGWEDSQRPFEEVVPNGGNGVGADGAGSNGTSSESGSVESAS